MLSKVTRLTHVGLFHNGTPTPLEFLKATLIYGENGRGKSTLAAILDSCARARPDLILCRATIDEAAPAPAIELIFDKGAQKVTFSAGQWTTQRPDILVFDSQFVHENACTGLEVTTENRRGLYEFALGDAVRDVQEMERAARAKLETGLRRGERERALMSYARPFSVKDFVALTADPDIDTKLEHARRRRTARSQAEQVLRRQDLIPLHPPPVNLPEVFALLRRNLPQVQADAEKQVTAHFRAHGHTGVEDWVSRGRQFGDDQDCPYCGQAADGIRLITAYREYFSAEYRDLKANIATVRQQVSQVLDQAIAARLSDIAQGNLSRQGAWSDLARLDAIEIDLAAPSEALNSQRDLLLRLLDSKQTQPLEVVGTDDELEQARVLSAQFRGPLMRYNGSVASANQQYAELKRQVAGGNMDALNKEVENLEAVKRRFTDAADLVESYVQADLDATAATADKDRLREEHDRKMLEALGKYEGAINRRLNALRAGFTIERLEQRHDAGQKPRASYAIGLRGRTIQQLDHSGNGQHSLPTALSDGDRRSLALAFFLARLDLDPQMQGRVVVFDDPMTSFDENRKLQTAQALLAIAQRCEQLIVFSHDAYFLRELSVLIQDAGIGCATRKVEYAKNDYAVFADCDLNEICMSLYYQRYRLVAGYLAGESSSIRAVAESLRTLVEGFYKRRYPGRISNAAVFGAIITEIRKAGAGDPLAALQPIADQLERFNDYAGQYHHDSNPQYDQSDRIVEKDLRYYAAGALSLIHDDGRSAPMNG